MKRLIGAVAVSTALLSLSAAGFAQVAVTAPPAGNQL